MAMKKIASSVVVVALLSSLVVVCTSATPLKRRRSLGIIGQLNHEGPYLGLLTVYPPEEEAFFATGAFEPHPRHPFIDLSGRRFRIGKIHGKRVVYVRCGIGMVCGLIKAQYSPSSSSFWGIVNRYGERVRSDDKLVKWFPRDCHQRAIGLSGRTNWTEYSSAIWASGSSQYCQSCHWVHQIPAMNASV